LQLFFPPLDSRPILLPGLPFFFGGGGWTSILLLYYVLLQEGWTPTLFLPCGLASFYPLFSLTFLFPLHYLSVCLWEHKWSGHISPSVWIWQGAKMELGGVYKHLLGHGSQSNHLLKGEGCQLPPSAHHASITLIPISWFWHHESRSVFLTSCYPFWLLTAVEYDAWQSDRVRRHSGLKFDIILIQKLRNQIRLVTSDQLYDLVISWLL
jgi:hypothetical protein